MGDLIALFAIAMPFSIPIVAIWARHQRKMAELQAQNPATLAPETDQRIIDLEDRVRVLERIVTEKSYSVAQEIEALRDQPARIAAQPDLSSQPKRKASTRTRAKSARRIAETQGIEA